MSVSSNMAIKELYYITLYIYIYIILLGISGGARAPLGPHVSPSLPDSHFPHFKI